MKRPLHLVLAGAVAIAVLAVWRLTSTGGISGPNLLSSEAEPPGGEDRHPQVLEPDPEARSVDRVAPSGEAQPAAVAKDPGAVRGTVVDGSNKPVSGAEIRALQVIPRDTEWFDVEARRRRREVAEARSDASGRFELRVDEGRPHDLRAFAPGFADATCSDAFSGQDLTLVLRRSALLTGVVRLEEVGTPVAGARMFLADIDDGAMEWEGKTDEEGRYVAQNIQPGTFSLLVYPQEQSETPMFLVLAEGETRTLDVSIAPGTTVVGAVKDARTGLPIAGAEVSSDAFLLKIAKTDDSGSYTLRGVSTERILARICARAPSYGGRVSELEIAENAVLRADFELVHGRALRGRLVDGAGTPIGDAYVAAIASQDRVSTRSGIDGRFLLADLRTDLPHSLFVRKERFATTLARQVDAGVTEDTDLGDVVIPLGATLSGRVVTSAGDSIQAARIELRPAAEEDETGEDPLGPQAKSDARGFFSFADLASGKFVVEVEAQGVPLEKRWTVELAEGEAKRGFQIVIGEGRSITGRVVDPQGIGIENADVVLDQPYASARSLHGGTFRFHGLERGEYSLLATFVDEYGPPDDRYRLIVGRVEGVAAGADDVLIRLRRAAEITGRVTVPDGVDLVRILVMAADAQGRPVDVNHADSSGRFTLRVPAEEFVELRAWMDGGGAEPQAVRSGVRGGDRDIVLALKP